MIRRVARKMHDLALQFANFENLFIFKIVVECAVPLSLINAVLASESLLNIGNTLTDSNPRLTTLELGKLVLEVLGGG